MFACYVAMHVFTLPTRILRNNDYAGTEYLPIINLHTGIFIGVYEVTNDYTLSNA